MTSKVSRSKKREVTTKELSQTGGEERDIKNEIMDPV